MSRPPVCPQGIGHAPVDTDTVKEPSAVWQNSWFVLFMTLFSVAPAILASTCSSSDFFAVDWTQQYIDSLLAAVVATAWVAFGWWFLYFGKLRQANLFGLPGGVWLQVAIALELTSFIGAALLMGAAGRSTPSYGLLVAFLILKVLAYAGGHIKVVRGDSVVYSRAGSGLFQNPLFSGGAGSADSVASQLWSSFM